MSLDELVSKAIRRGIDGVGWKGQLARFLDLQVGQVVLFAYRCADASLQGIIYFSGDPTGNRRRR